MAAGRLFLEKIVHGVIDFQTSFCQIEQHLRKMEFDNFFNQQHPKGDPFRTFLLKFLLLHIEILSVN